MRAVKQVVFSLAPDRWICDGVAVEVASMIRGAREVLGLTQQQLAERMGSTQSAVTRWEGGEHEVTMRTLSRVAEALGIEFFVHFGTKGAET